MAIMFPTLIEFIDEIGLEDLHAAHTDYMNDKNEEISFNEFVKFHYESLRESWAEDIQYTPKKNLDVPFNEENEIALETAKQVMVSIINKALENRIVSKVICDESMVPNYFMVYPVIEEFFAKVVPAVEKSINELEG